MSAAPTETARGVGGASGKAILVGEHFVVYGAPAIAIPVRGRGVTVRLRREPGPWAVPAAALAHMTAMVRHLGLDPDALTVALEATLPLGVGLGGSASVAAALVRATGVADPVEVQRMAHALEELAHGTPSGLDDTTVAYERPIWFRRGQPPEVLAPRALPMLLAVTPPGGSTKVAVAGVAAWRAHNAARFAAILARSEAIAHAAREGLVASDLAAVGAAMNEAHELLSEVGVSTPTLDRVVARARALGAHGAKLTGAGLGGAVLVCAPPALAPDLEAALRAEGAEEVFPV
ncbi:MAG: mevalonate kinase [Myxococcales bacterium]|nr:mevalonate kinase [Myxococcales bacterium]MCB9733984.1 mevalonate kinase [Deltaproteobacteria bacterium]